MNAFYRVILWSEKVKIENIKYHTKEAREDQESVHCAVQWYSKVSPYQLFQVRIISFVTICLQ